MKREERVEKDIDTSIQELTDGVNAMQRRKLAELWQNGYDQAMRDFRVGPYVSKNEVNKI